jgi:hypothetical protein
VRSTVLHLIFGVLVMLTETASKWLDIVRLESLCYIFTALAFVLLSLPAHAANETASTRALLPSQRSALIDQLQTAKSRDWESAIDPNVPPVTREDFLDQMSKADRAIRELRYGFTVSQHELSEALWVLPKYISPRERARLIDQLQAAKRADDHNEQQMLNDWWTDQPARTEQFDLQKKLVDDVLEDLEIGEPVHWWTIKQALYVPRAPY